MSKAPIRALCLTLGLCFASDVSHRSITHSANAATDRVLELAVEIVKADTSDEQVAAAAEALAEAASEMDGLEWTADAGFASENGGKRWLHARIWGSVAHAEAASLAFDGSEALGDVTEVTDPRRRQVWHFRSLRSHSYSEDAARHLEVVVFRTKPGTTRETNLERFDAGESEFEKGEGLLGHSLWLAPDGRWVHLLRWRSAADYAKTGKALFRTKNVGGWIRSLDFRRFTVLRGDRI